LERISIGQCSEEEGVRVVWKGLQCSSCKLRNSGRELVGLYLTVDSNKLSMEEISKIVHYTTMVMKLVCAMIDMVNSCSR
jgi:hypothetical protein